MATSNITAQPFIADAKSIDRLNGASIKWSVVTEVDDNGNKFIPAGSVMSRETGGFAPAKVATAEVCGIMENFTGSLRQRFHLAHLRRQP